jgi:hypothetical protein
MSRWKQRQKYAWVDMYLDANRVWSESRSSQTRISQVGGVVDELSVCRLEVYAVERVVAMRMPYETGRVKIVWVWTCGK